MELNWKFLTVKKLIGLSGKIMLQGVHFSNKAKKHSIRLNEVGAFFACILNLKLHQLKGGVISGYA